MYKEDGKVKFFNMIVRNVPCCSVPHSRFFLLVGDSSLQDVEAPKWRKDSRYCYIARRLSVDNNCE